MQERKRVLIFADYYLPSVGAGGGVRILANIVERFSDRYEFFVVARDHDSKTDRTPFKDFPLNTWTSLDGTHVYYFSRHKLTSSVTDSIVEFAAPDLVFLNSIFSIPSVRFLWERRKGKYSGIPVIISPCGEVLSEGLKRKTLKKVSYLKVANALGFHKDVIWRATSEIERKDIVGAVGSSPEIHIVPDLTPRSIGSEVNGSKPAKPAGYARLIYVARIVPNKNLLFLLELLSQQIEGTIELEIIGPAEDKDYWGKCVDTIKQLPKNVRVQVAGLLRHEEVIERLNSSHFFVLPTETENFGYAIVEALALACPVLLSDNTHWNDLNGGDIAWILPLSDKARWSSAIHECIEMPENEYQDKSRQAREFANEWLSSSESENKMEAMFLAAMSKTERD